MRPLVTSEVVSPKELRTMRFQPRTTTRSHLAVLTKRLSPFYSDNYPDAA